MLENTRQNNHNDYVFQEYDYVWSMSDINENENPDEMDTDYCVEEFDKDTRNDRVSFEYMEKVVAYSIDH